jgi:cytidine deaminase
MMQEKTLGVFTRFEDLDPIERKLVKGTWDVAENAYVPRSKFPVGSVLLVQNDQGDKRLFSGCNVENRFFPPTICAERNAMTTAVAAGYRKLLRAALVLKNYQGPGASPCGVCRQVLVEFGCDAVMFNMADKQCNVHKFLVCDLLPAASGEKVPFEQLPGQTKRLVKRLESLRQKSYVPYSKAPHAAMFIATNGNNATRQFIGVSDDNASYGASALAETVAMRAARTAGYDRNVTLAVMVDDALAHNPIDGACLQVLREFGENAKVLLVGNDRCVVHSNVDELLPDSFGPQSLV